MLVSKAQVNDGIKEITLQFEEDDITSIIIESYSDGYNAMTVGVKMKNGDRVSLVYRWQNRDDLPDFVIDMKAALDKLGLK